MELHKPSVLGHGCHAGETEQSCVAHYNSGSGHAGVDHVQHPVAIIGQVLEEAFPKCHRVRRIAGVCVANQSSLF